MTQLESFGDGIRAVVIGASGGIGSAFVRALAADPAVVRVYAFARSALPAEGDKVTAGRIDIEDEASIVSAADLLGDDDVHLVLVPTGILHEGDLMPERQLKELDPARLARVFAVNTIGPAIVAKHFLPKLARRTKTVFAALSARVGSIGDNRLGGWASYRASKAALNQLLKTIAIEQTRRRPQSIVAALHPGTVDTPLSKPFTSRTPEEKLFTPEQSADYLLRVVDSLAPDDSGGFFAWDGTRIQY